MSDNSSRDAGRSLLVARARVARGLLVEVQRSRLRYVRSKPGEIDRALAALTRFAASSGELQSEDRAAHRIAQAWLRDRSNIKLRRALLTKTPAGSDT